MKTILAVVMLTAVTAWAQERAPDPVLDAAVAKVRTAQAAVDSILGARTLAATKAVFDTTYAELVAAGVKLTRAPDPLYVLVDVPYSRATAAEQLLWREARLAVAQTAGEGALLDSGVPWRWKVHRADLLKVAAALKGVVAPVGE